MTTASRRKPTGAKTQRLEARITADQKRRLEHAARLRGASLTDFVVLSATEAANRTIAEQQLMQLSERDSRVFVEALLNPPAPSPRLAAAAKRYRERLRGGAGAPERGGAGAPERGGAGAPERGGAGAPERGGAGAPERGGAGAPERGGAGAP